jgi:hypothetical protein
MEALLRLYNEVSIKALLRLSLLCAIPSVSPIPALFLCQGSINALLRLFQGSITAILRLC